MQPSSATIHPYVIDLVHEQPDPPVHDPPHHRFKDKKVLCRDPRTIDGIVVHQTACWFGTSDQQLRLAGGDKVLAKHRRALNVAAHMTAFDTGFAVLAHPINWYVYHANKLNARSIGFEVEGRYPGVQGTRTVFTSKLEQAARAGLLYLVERGRAAGMPIKWIWAHRQSSMTRPDDPGEELWRKLVLGFAVKELGLQTKNDFVDGGRPVPTCWYRDKSAGA